MTTGKIVNLISTDTSRLDMAATSMQLLLVAPVQFGVAFALLIASLGPSALAGFAVLFIFGPSQTMVMRKMANLRKAIMPITDKRIKLAQEVLQGIRVVKFFAWEENFLGKLAGLRVLELVKTRTLMIVRGIVSSIAAVSRGWVCIVIMFFD
jgi:ATP-binding cassette subfamily C (CFTR/MRP) protein 1